MTNRWVINASPLIALGRVGQAQLIEKLADDLIVPQAVAGEIAAGPLYDAAKRFLDSQETLSIVDVTANRAIQAWDLGAGETALLSYALANREFTALLDDGMTRKCAQSFAIPIKGTLAIILQAKQRELVPSASSILRDLRETGFHLDEQLIRRALKETVDEDWP